MSVKHLVKHGNNLVCMFQKARLFVQCRCKLASSRSPHTVQGDTWGACAGACVCASVYLGRVNLSDPPVLHLCGGVLDPGLHQDALVLALLFQPLMALKDVPDVGGQMQHVNIPE